MAPAIEEILYPAMEDYELDIVIGQGPGARSVKVPLQPFTLVGATTRAGLLTSPLRARFGIVHRLDFYGERRHRGDRARGRRAFSACRSTTTAARGDRAAVARHAAHRQPAAAAGARLRAGARRRAHHRWRWRARRCELLEVDEHGLRRESIAGCCGRSSTSSAAARSGLGTLAAAHQRRDGRDRGHLRAVPDPDRVPRAHAARPRGHGARLRVLRAAPRPGRDSSVVNAPTTLGRASAHQEPGHLRAAARADQRRPREDGRHHRRVDPAAHRHPRAPHRRPGRGDVATSPTEAAREAIERGRASRPTTSTSSSSARRRPT